MIWLDGLTCYVAVVCYVTFKILMDFHSHVTAVFVLILLSCLCIFPCLALLSDMSFSVAYHEFSTLMSFP